MEKTEVFSVHAPSESEWDKMFETSIHFFLIHPRLPQKNNISSHYNTIVRHKTACVVMVSESKTLIAITWTEKKNKKLLVDRKVCTKFIDACCWITCCCMLMYYCVGVHPGLSWFLCGGALTNKPACFRLHYSNHCCNQSHSCNETNMNLKGNDDSMMT